jgi:hypothetical protein
VAAGVVEDEVVEQARCRRGKTALNSPQEMYVTVYAKAVVVPAVVAAAVEVVEQAAENMTGTTALDVGTIELFILLFNFETVYISVFVTV